MVRYRQELDGDMPMTMMNNDNRTAEREMIVRICWFPKSPPAKADPDTGLYRVRARFDEAIDAESGERIGKGQFQWLEWSFRKRLFGDPFGFTMKTGSLYRVRLQKQDAPGQNGTVWELKEMLEKNVKDRRLDPIQSFLNTFAEEETELVFLNKNSISGWGVFWGWKRICMTYIAVLDPSSGKVRKETGRIFLLEKNADGMLKTKLKDLTVYRASVRRSLDQKRTWLAVGHPVSEDASLFASYIEEYNTPVILEDALGTFTLNRRYNWFEGTIQWCGQDCSVLLETEEGETDCSRGLAVLHTISQDAASFDARVREQVADQTMELLEDWYDEPVTREDYIRGLGTPSITVGVKGDMEFSFDCMEDDYYAGHVLLVPVSEDGTVGEAYLAG